MTIAEKTMNEIGGYIFFAGVVLLTLLAVLARLLPEEDSRFRTGYKNNEEVTTSIYTFLAILFSIAVGLVFIGFFMMFLTPSHLQ